MDEHFAGLPCAVEGCGKESCAPVHMVSDESGGHDYRSPNHA